MASKIGKFETFPNGDKFEADLTTWLADIK